jgi:hypothetical protein
MLAIPETLPAETEQKLRARDAGCLLCYRNRDRIASEFSSAECGPRAVRLGSQGKHVLI